MSKNQIQANKVVSALTALNHDLGKKIRLPLTVLDAEASPAEVRKALEKALLKTQKKGDKIASAREIWDSFLRQIDGSLDEEGAFQELKESVERALAWEDAVKDPKSQIDRDILEDDLDAVGHAIQVILEEVSGD